MSVENDIIQELKDFIADQEPSLSGRISFTQVLSEQKQIGEQFLRLSTSANRMERRAIGISDRIVEVQINYYRRSKSKYSLDFGAEIKDAILHNLPASNRPYWRYWDSVYDENITDIDDESYEGWTLRIEFYKATATVCQDNNTYIYSEDGIPLISEDGYRIVGD